MGKCDIRAAGLSFGIVWSALIFLCGIFSMFFNWGTKFVEVFADIYPGYHASILGNVIGAFWGFVDGAIGGALLAWLYNKFSKT
jgi:hypothetical protein